MNATAYIMSLLLRCERSIFKLLNKNIAKITPINVNSRPSMNSSTDPATHMILKSLQKLSLATDNAAKDCPAVAPLASNNKNGATTLACVHLPTPTIPASIIGIKKPNHYLIDPATLFLANGSLSASFLSCSLINQNPMLIIAPNPTIKLK